MAYNYVVTAHRASAVNHVLRGNFVTSDEMNLIVVKNSRFEIHKITENGLKLTREINVYGSIVALKKFRPSNENKDLLFMLTHKNQASILECIEGKTNDSIDVVTRAAGDVGDPSCRKSELNNIVIIDPSGHLIGLRLYDGLFKVIPVEKKSELQAFNIRMEEDVVRDIVFLHGCSNPTIGIVYKDQVQTNHIKTYEISMREKCFRQGPWTKENIANEAILMIPVPKPFGGAIIISNESIIYHSNEYYKVIAPSLMKQYPMVCYAPIDDQSCSNADGHRFLLGDISGRLFCLILEASDYRHSTDGELDLKDMRLELLGEVSIPECLVYIDNGVVFIGSRMGDSQLVKLNTEPDENGSLVRILETYPNLGPISDMSLVDLEKQGQGQLVTCSGYQKEGSLRIIRNGIGINEQASIDLSGLKGMWPLNIGPTEQRDSHLVVTFLCSTFIWSLKPNYQVESIMLEGFNLYTQTLYCGNTIHNGLIQVSFEEIRLANAADGKLVYSWRPPNNQSISVVSCNKVQVVCACKNWLYYLEIDKEELRLKKSIEMEDEVACIDITPTYRDKTDICAVGFWCNICIRIFELPTFSVLHKEELHSEIIPRSLLIVKFEETVYLLCALGDGLVFYFHLNTEDGMLKNRKKVTLGTQQTILKTFQSQDSTNVFACSDRPTVIYSSNNKLVFSNVNLKEVNYMCPLDSKAYPDSLALESSDKSLIIGTIDKIQKLHIRTVPLHETPYKITHQESTQTFGLLTNRFDVQDDNGPVPVRSSASTRALRTSTALAMTSCLSKPTCPKVENGMDIEIHNLLILDQNTFEVLHSHRYMAGEYAVSVLSTKLGQNNEDYFIVGTCFSNQDEPEPKLGRLIVYQWKKLAEEYKLQQITEMSVKGAPYSLCEFGSKFLVGVNASVFLIELNEDYDLKVECSYVNATIALHVKRVKDTILLGDLMRSIALFAYKPLESHFEEIARDFNPAWMTEVEFLDENTFLGAEHGFNLFVAQKDETGLNEQERQQLQQVGQYHLGDMVNKFVSGSLVVSHPGENSIEIKKTILYGTVEGSIGLILYIDEPLYKKLELVQTRLYKSLKSVGHIDHSEWRASYGEKSSLPATNFIDGDLVETFLDLPRGHMELIAYDVNRTPVEDLVKTIEELSRIH